MHPRQLVPIPLSRLALFQAGVVTRTQALEAGLSRHALCRLTSDGTWLRVCRGVFVIDASPRWDALAWAGVLVAGEGSRLGGLAAGHLGGLVDAAPERIEVWLPKSVDVPRRQPIGPALGQSADVSWVFRREAVGMRERSVGSPPRTNIEDTVLDLVDDAERAEAIGWLSSAVQRRLTTPRRLLAAADHRPFCRHRGLLRSVLSDVAVGAESPLELKYLRDVERAHGLPVAVRQVRQRGTAVDALYEEYGLVVELDGLLGHVGAGRFRDMARDNRSTGAGLATLRYGWRDVDLEPCLVAVQVGQVLASRGWNGLIERCRRCRSLRVSTSAG